MTRKEALKILMESPIYFLFTLNERKQMITEFCLLYGTK
jgi:hypothetical protein